MNKNYCEFCNDFNEYEIKEKIVKENIHNVEIEYIKKKTYCTQCKNEIFVNNIMDENMQLLQRKYREKMGIITVDEIEKIVKMYGIGKRNLSKLLGFGEITLTRFLDNDIPTRLYSEMLFKVLDYKQMLLIAQENRQKVDEKVYNKFLDNIKIHIESENKNKLIAVSKYIVSKTKDVTNLAVQKMLYFCQIISFAVNDKMLFCDSCEAWKYGPVYPSIYYRLNKYTYDCIKPDEFSNLAVLALNEKDKEIIDAVINSFGMLSGSTLRDLSHKTEPWMDARKGILDSENSNQVITNKSIREYAKSILPNDNKQDINTFCMKYMKELLGDKI